MQANDRKTLEGWKEIAAHLRASVRTVQQWESERGLPVRRMGSARGRVWIEVEELEKWRAGLALPPTSQEPRRAIWPMAVGVSVVVLLAVLGLIASRSSLQVAKVAHDGRQLVATDAEGRLLWTHPFDSVRDVVAGQKRPDGLLADLDEDGQVEVLALNVAAPDHLGSNGLFCFDSSGRLKWHFQPGRSVRTAREAFDPPYNVNKVVPFKSRLKGPWRIAVVSIHSVYFPSQVAVLDEHGKLLREYWHAGHLHDLRAGDLDGDGKPEFYVTGLSNGFRNAVVLALDPEKMEGAGWEESANYRFESMKPGVEIARWLTPRTPLSIRMSRYNCSLHIELNSKGVMATTIEYFPVEELGLFLTFGPRLENPQWSQSDTYLTGFGRCKAQGILTTETPESEARGTTGFRDVTYRRQEAASRRTTERGATR